MHKYAKATTNLNVSTPSYTSGIKLTHGYSPSTSKEESKGTPLNGKIATAL